MISDIEIRKLELVSQSMLSSEGLDGMAANVRLSIYKECVEVETIRLKTYIYETQRIIDKGFHSIPINSWNMFKRDY